MTGSLKKTITKKSGRFIKAYFAPITAKLGVSLATTLTRIPKSTKIFFDPDYHIFFGYYDVSPFSLDDRYLLACRVSIKELAQNKISPSMDVGFFDLNKETLQFNKLGETSAWNWQQGCRLQWTSSESTEVIYNVFTSGRFNSRIKNLKGDVSKDIPLPIYSVTNGTEALTLNFTKLHNFRPGYGYTNLKYTKESDEKDGIWRINLSSGEYYKLFALSEITSFQPLDSMIGAEHYLNHLEYRPDGKGCIWTHLWVKNGAKHSRIFYYDFISEELSCLNNVGKTSHYAWQDNNHLLVYSKFSSNRNGYVLYDISGRTSRILGEGILREDGHPSFISDNRFITDTYPDAFRRQHLYIYDINTAEVKSIAKIVSPIEYTGVVRCDLHPRLNRAGTKVCIDFVKDNRRSMAILEL